MASQKRSMSRRLVPQEPPFNGVHVPEDARRIKIRNEYCIIIIVYIFSYSKRLSHSVAFADVSKDIGIRVISEVYWGNFSAQIESKDALTVFVLLSECLFASSPSTQVSVTVTPSSVPVSVSV